MTINLITFASILHKQVTIRSSHEAVLSELEKYFTVKFVDYRDIHQLTKDDFSIIFIATGGVERLVMQCFESLPRPAIILADGMQNSLAAALEISSWLRGRGMKSEILHGDFEEYRPENTGTIYQFQGAAFVGRTPHRGDRHSLFLVDCKQCGLPARKTTLGDRVSGHPVGTDL